MAVHGRLENWLVFTVDSNLYVVNEKQIFTSYTCSTFGPIASKFKISGWELVEVK